MKIKELFIIAFRHLALRRFAWVMVTYDGVSGRQKLII